MWIENQGPPPHGENFIRSPFDDRPGGPRRSTGPGGPGPRFRTDRSRDRQSRWSKEDPKESLPRSKADKKPEDEESRSENLEPNEPVRDTQTPCHDEKPIEEIQPSDPPVQTTLQKPNEFSVEGSVEQSDPLIEYDRDTATPCHDEPEIPNIVSENPEMLKKEQEQSSQPFEEL